MPERPCMSCPHPNTSHDPSLSPESRNPCLVADCPCDHYAEPTLTFPVSDMDVVCISCDRPLPPGAPVGQPVVGMAGDHLVVELACVYCAVAS